MAKNKQPDFQKAGVLRIYDTELLNKLADHYTENGLGESKNQFLIGLIEAGLLWRKREQELLTVLSDADNQIAEKISELTKRVGTMESYMRTEYKFLYGYTYMNSQFTGAIYYMLEALNAQQYIPQTELEGGYYDGVPDRFLKIKEDALNRYGY